MKTRRGRRGTSRRRSSRKLRRRTAKKRGGGYTMNMNSGGIAGMPVVDKFDTYGVDTSRGGNSLFGGKRRRKQKAGGSAIEMQSPIAGYGFAGQSVRPGAEVFQSIY